MIKVTVLISSSLSFTLALLIKGSVADLSRQQGMSLLFKLD